MGELVLKPNLRKLLSMLLLCIIFVFAGILVIKDSKTDFLLKLFGGYLAILFFGSGGILIIYKIILRRPSLIISSQGIYPAYVRNSLRKLILWEDIAKIRIARQYYIGGKTDYLVIYLNNPQKFNFESGKMMSKAVTQAFGSKLEDDFRGNVYVPFSLLPYKAQKMINLLKAYPVDVE